MMGNCEAIGGRFYGYLWMAFVSSATMIGDQTFVEIGKRFYMVSVQKGSFPMMTFFLLAHPYTNQGKY